MGYALHITCTAPDPYNPGPHPILAIAATLDTPNKRNGENAAAMLGSIVERGHPVGYAVSDRGYFNAADAESFNRPINALGYKLVGDYNGTGYGKKQQNLGISGTRRGAIFVEGAWYCPSMPQDLIDATTILRDDHDFRANAKRIRQRKKYAFRPKHGDAMFCPAVGPGATASCALKPNGPVFLGALSHRPFAVVLDPPEDPPTCCTNHSSTTLNAETNAKIEKLTQSLTYGSREWLDMYKPLRAIIEGFNAYAKDDKHASVAKKANRRIRGFAANALVTALTLAATNIRKIKAFYDADRPLSMEPRPRPKPDHAWEDEVGAKDPYSRDTWDEPRQREPAPKPAAA